MKNRTIIIAAGLFTLLWFIFALNIWWGVSPLPEKEIEELVKRITPSQEITPTREEVRVDFTMNPSKLTRYAGDEFEVNVLLESEEKMIGADLNFVFDAHILAIKNIKKGEFFAHAQELKKDINNKDGQAFYAVGTITPVSGKGVLVTLLVEARRDLEESQEARITLTEDTQIATEKTSVSLGSPVSGEYSILEKASEY
jgi:hypothetical protein